jgi:mono/diheme cytochrome c family protein
MERSLRNSAAPKWLGTTALALALVTLAGCRQDMHNQPKYKPLRESDFYADRRSARPLVEGTVARGDLQQDSYYYTGKVNGQPGNELPMPVTKELLDRGEERYNVFCSPCHSRVGDGNGMIVQRGFKQPPSYHSDRLRRAPIGHFYDVITNGFGAMSEYKSQVPVADRWAIAAYIRALQLSQNASRADVPAGTELSSTPPNTNNRSIPPMNESKETHGGAEAGSREAEPK